MKPWGKTELRQQNTELSELLLPIKIYKKRIPSEYRETGVHVLWGHCFQEEFHGTKKQIFSSGIEDRARLLPFHLDCGTAASGIRDLCRVHHVPVGDHHPVGIPQDHGRQDCKLSGNGRAGRGGDSTLAVNVVIGTHFLANMDFGLGFILNELMLVLVGTAVGVFVNLFQNTSRIQKLIRQEIAVADRHMQEILRQIVKELTVPESSENVWKQLEELETHLQQCLAQAHEYRENHFAAHPEYYVGYFEMRIRQCVILRSLQNEIRRIRQFPEQARMVAEFIAYVGEHVLERNEPAAQMNRLDLLFRQMKETPLPASREEFENRAILYHILMDLEEFLKMKKKFVDSLTEDQMERYWQSNG